MDIFTNEITIPKNYNTSVDIFPQAQSLLQ